MLAAVAVSAALSILPPVEAFPRPNGEPAGAERSSCALPAIAQTLRHAEAWQDLTAKARRDASLADALAAQMPGYRLAFRHTPSAGVLQIRIRTEDGSAGAEVGRAHWKETAAAAQEMCVQNGLDCEVAALAGAPFGLQASTRIPDGAQVIRRETLSFADGRGCGYSVQFTSEQSAFSDGGWQAVRSALLKLRRLVLPVRQSRR